MTHPIAVVGGGVAGLGAAIELGRRGLPVTLIEAEAELGGHAARWACMATSACQRCGACLAHDALAEVTRLPSVTLRKGTAVRAAERDGEALRLHLGAGGVEGPGTSSLEASGVVLATGFSPFAPREGRPVGAAGHPAVITTVDLNRALREDRAGELPFGDGDHQRLAVLHCVGSRDPAAGREACSQICCGVAFKAARRLLHLRPGWELTLFHIDLQIHGKEARAAFASHHGIRLVQGVPAEIRPPQGASEAASEAPGARPGALELVYQGVDGQVVTAPFDGAILAVGMRPRSGTASLAGALGLGAGASGFLEAGAGPDPRVVAAGACRGPASIESSLLQGRAAAARLLGALPRPAAGLWALGARGAPAPAAGNDTDPSPPTTPALPVERAVAVVGRGPAAAVLAARLRDAGLPVRWLQPTDGGGDGPTAERAPDPTPAGDVSPTPVRAIHRLEGTLGAFRLDATTLRAPERVQCGAVVLCDEPRVAAPRLAGAIALEGLEPPNPAEPLPDAPPRVALWLDAHGPAWRPVAARLLAELADAQADGRAHVTLIADHVALPGLAAQGHYDRARRAGLRVLRPGGLAPSARREGDRATLSLRHALVPEVDVELTVDALYEAAFPAPDPARARALGIAPDAEGFAPAGNVRLAPLVTERPGVYVVGAGRGEGLPAERAAEREALVAELRDLLGPGEAAAPLGVAVIDEGRCVHCLTCLRSCPHQAVTTPPHGAPVIAPLACEGCGRCLALCPAVAIRWAGGPDLPPRTTLHPAAGRRPTPSPGEIHCFACRHSGAPALAAAGRAGLLGALALRLEEVPCLGAVSELAVLGALLAGAPRVALLGCHPGSCAHVDGDVHCALRVGRLRQTLADIGHPPGTVVHLPLSPAEPARLAAALRAALAQGGQP